MHKPRRGLALHIRTALWPRRQTQPGMHAQHAPEIERNGRRHVTGDVSRRRIALVIALLIGAQPAFETMVYDGQTGHSAALTSRHISERRRTFRDGSPVAYGGRWQISVIPCAGVLLTISNGDRNGHSGIE